MAFIPIRNVGRGGIVTDQDPYDLNLTQFGSGNNVAFADGRIGKALGYTGYTTPTESPTHIQSWQVSGGSSLVYGSLTKLYKFDGSSHTNVSKTSDTFNYSTSERWQSVQAGQAVIMNNGSDAPQFLLPAGSRFADLTAWPSGMTTSCIKPYNSFLVCAGYEDGSGAYPYTVRWSDEFDPTTVPSDWNIASTTNLAGENFLSGHNGVLVDQKTLGGSNMIYAEHGVFAMDYIGAPLVFSFREVFNDDGIINRGAVASFFNRHLVVGHNDIYIHDGNSKQSVADKRVRREFYSLVADERSVYCVEVPQRSEIWICFADNDASDSETANRALVYNWAQEAWTFQDIPETRAMSISDTISSVGAWDNQTVTWNQSSDYWSTLGATTDSSTLKLFAAGTTDTKIYQMLDGYSSDGTACDSFLEITKMDLDELTGQATNTIKRINQMFPQISGDGTVNIQLGYSNAPQEGVTWMPAVPYNVGTDHKVDIRSSGRYLAMRIESSGATDWWILNGLDIEVLEVAKR